MYYLCGNNKGADKLHGYHVADLHLCFWIPKSRFSYDTAQMIMIFVSSLDKKLRTYVVGALSNYNIGLKGEIANPSSEIFKKNSAVKIMVYCIGM